MTDANEELLGLVALFNEVNGIFDALHFISVAIRNFDREFILKIHHKLDRIEGVKAEIGAEIADNAVLGLVPEGGARRSARSVNRETRNKPAARTRRNVH